MGVEKAGAATVREVHSGQELQKHVAFIHLALEVLSA